MSERKNIDKLFQEKFKDFEAAPSDEVWPYLKEKLKEKKDRKVIPFWWKLSGIAAGLLLSLVLWEGFFNQKTDDRNGNRVVIQERQNRENSISSPTVNNADFGKPVATDETSEDKKQNTTAPESRNRNSDAMVANPKDNAKPLSGASDHSGWVTNENKSANRSTSQSREQNQSEPNNSQLHGINARTNQPLVGNEKANKGQIVQSNSGQTQIASAKNAQRLVDKNSKKPGQPKVAQAIAEKEPVSDPKNQTPNNTAAGIQNIDSKIARQNNRHEETPSVNKSTNPFDSPKNPIAATASKSPDKKIDSTAIATVVPNALEELLNEKENNLVTKGPQINRWQVTSSVAPIYFGSTTGGSPIDTAFAGNSKEYRANLSVRLGVNYALNKKLSIRTGVSNVTFDYNTKDVLISTGIERNSLANVNTNGQNQFLHFGSARKAAAQNAAASSGLVGTEQFASYLNQRMSYIEVPLEISYVVIDKKIGINIIGGVSTLFLNENKILVVSDGLTTHLGEANNLNKTHFSSNIGLGLRYRFYKAFQANFEPMFKYQINTFSKDAGNFKPYYFGLYTGVSYSF